MGVSRQEKEQRTAHTTPCTGYGGTFLGRMTGPGPWPLLTPTARPAPLQNSLGMAGCGMVRRNWWGAKQCSPPRPGMSSSKGHLVCRLSNPAPPATPTCPEEEPT